MENIENYWAVISLLFRVLELIVEGAAISFFVRPFLSKKATAKWVGFTYVFVMLYLAWISVVIDYPTIIAILFSLFVMWVFDRKNGLQKIVLAVTMYLIQWIAHGISLIPRNLLFSLVISTDYMMDRVWLQLVVFAFTEALTCMVTAILLYGLVKGLHLVYTDKQANVSGKECLLLFSVLATVVVGCLTFSWFSDIYLAETGSYIWNIHEEYLIFEIIFQVVSCVSLFVMIVSYQKIKAKQQEEKENAILAKQMEDMKIHIAEVERLYGDIRGLKHDMGNHIQVLEQLFLKNEKAELEHYFSELKEKWSESTAGIKSGNPITDIILTQKQKEALEKGIAFECDFHYPTETILEAFDVSVILNNGLENALRGVEGCDKPTVIVRSYRKKNAYMIEMENSIHEKVNLDEKTGFPVSTKKIKENHGFGLINIRKIVQKYYGDIDITQNDTTFLLSIMLMIK